MTISYLSKEGMAVIATSRYLMTTTVGDRLRTIDDLSEEFEISVGLIQKAFTTLEQSQAVQLSKQGRNGTFIHRLNERELIKFSGISHLVCAMPLPYIKHYEGLASGLREQFSQMPLYFAHMRGASARAECLKAGTVDVAIMSKLACLALGKGLYQAFELGDESYSPEHKLIYRAGEFDSITKVGVDPASPDQVVLTEKAFMGQQVETIEINYANSLSLLTSGLIDAVVWLPEAIDMQKAGLEEKSLSYIPECKMASQAVMLVNPGSPHISKLFKRLLNIQQLLDHQREVISGERIPSY